LHRFLTGVRIVPCPQGGRPLDETADHALEDTVDLGELAGDVCAVKGYPEVGHRSSRFGGDADASVVTADAIGMAAQHLDPNGVFDHRWRGIALIAIASGVGPGGGPVGLGIVVGGARRGQQAHHDQHDQDGTGHGAILPSPVG
jgi:hypothetical protein